MIELLKQKPSLFVIRSLENQFLSFIVFYCYNQPLTKLASINWWRPLNLFSTMAAEEEEEKRKVGGGGGDNRLSNPPELSL